MENPPTNSLDQLDNLPPINNPEVNNQDEYRQKLEIISNAIDGVDNHVGDFNQKLDNLSSQVLGGNIYDPGMLKRDDLDNLMNALQEENKQLDNGEKISNPNQEKETDQGSEEGFNNDQDEQKSSGSVHGSFIEDLKNMQDIISQEDNLNSLGQGLFYKIDQMMNTGNWIPEELIPDIDQLKGVFNIIKTSQDSISENNALRKEVLETFSKISEDIKSVE